jgi:hypothetical protein
MSTLPRVCAVIVEGKGGVGKSLIAQVAAAMLRQGDRHRVGFLDTDTTNSSTFSIEEAAATAADLSKTEVRGTLKNTLQALHDREFDHVIVDTGARDEKRLIEILPWLAKEVKASGAAMVVVRPITLSSHVQQNAVKFMSSAKELGIGCVFVRNLGQGRAPEFFSHWLGTEARLNALKNGAVEIELTDAGARWGDEASGVGLSLADCALGNFQKAGPYENVARKIFDADLRAWLSIWLSEQVDTFHGAFAEALKSVNK